MELFIGTKAVRAKPMTYSEFSALKNLVRDSNEEGYLVEYLNSPNNEVVGFDNYISWSPKAVFEESYFKSGKMSFGLAFEAMRMGFIVSNEQLEKEGKKGILLDGNGTPQVLGFNGIERVWTPDLYSLRINEWKIVGLANQAK